MTDVSWREHRRRRWMRHNAHLYVRPDAYRFMPPGAPRHVGMDGVKYFWPDPEAEPPQKSVTDDADDADDIIAARERERQLLAEYQELLKLKSDLLWLRLELKLRRLLREQKYRPDQPRVPAGHPEGGQWTLIGDGGGGTDDARVLSDESPDAIRPGAQYAQDLTNRRYSVNLGEEEARGGHTIREHVGKSDQELLETLRARTARYVFGFVEVSPAGKRPGSFASIEAAGDFVNRTLEQNKPLVDIVANGTRAGAFITERFGCVTGREAFRPSPDAEPYLRNTYSVGVWILHDPHAARGYRIVTAFPRND